MFTQELLKDFNKRKASIKDYGELLGFIDELLTALDTAYTEEEGYLEQLKTEVPDNFKELFDNTMRRLAGIKLQVYKAVQELNGSSPLTQSSAINPIEETSMKYSSSSAGEKNIGRIVEKLNQEYEYYESTIARAQRLFPGIVWPYLDYYSIKNETNIPIIIESLLGTHKQIVNAWGELNDPEDESPLKSDYMAALLKVSNNFSNKIAAAIKELKQLSAMGDTGVSSPLAPQTTQAQEEELKTGGIDFTRINYLARPMGSFQGLDLRLPVLSKAELEGMDINKELASVEQMVNARIDVSTDRLKRLLAAMSKKDAFTSQRETQLLPLLLRLCWLKEENGAETTPDFRAVLLIADTGLFVEQGNTKYSLN